MTSPQPAQATFGSLEYAQKKKLTRRDKFLSEMGKIVPWAQLRDTIAPHYPTGKRGRPPIGIDRMLRIYFLQQWYALADEALEDAIYDSQALRDFVGVCLPVESVPDATTLLNFRRLLETHDLTSKILEVINGVLTEKGIMLKGGTIVDATIISAPSSTKNKDRQRDPEMHQTKKGNQWYHGMKAHVGVDAESGLVHTVEATAANVSDINEASKLIRDDDKTLYADAGYTGLEKREEMQSKAIETYQIAAKRGAVLSIADETVKNLTVEIERAKAQVRAFVEHPFHVIKNLFRHRKTRYRGIRKNHHQLKVLFALANLLIAHKKLRA
jgi:transposase, IS5 family